MTFMDDLRAGKVSPEDVDDYIDDWHEGEQSHRHLEDYLGMSIPLYQAWVVYPGVLRLFIGTDPSD